MKTASVELTIMIPVYNEAHTVAEVLNKTASISGINYEIIVVNDASFDGSLRVIEQWSKANPRAQLKLISHPTNLGKGAAIKTALSEARGGYFVVQDADLEYDPAEIKGLLEITDGSNAVYGSRFLGTITGMRWTNQLANRFYNFVVWLLYGVKITDMHTCYKMVPTTTLREMNLTSQGFDYATEIVSKLLLHKVPITEAPISYRGRTAEEGKKIGWHDGYDCLALLLRYRFTKTKFAGQPVLARFLMVGIIGFLTNFGFLFVFHGLLGLALLAAQLMAVEISIVVTFLLHHYWTYGHGGAWLKKLLQYNLSASIGALLNTVLLWVFVVKLGVHYLAALAAAAAIVMTWNYIINLKLIWSSKTQP